MDGGNVDNAGGNGRVIGCSGGGKDCSNDNGDDKTDCGGLKNIDSNGIGGGSGNGC